MTKLLVIAELLLSTALAGLHAFPFHAEGDPGFQDIAQSDASKGLRIRRPQEPTKPYPYRELEVSYPNVTAKITLAATLTIPPGNGPFPAAILITGSGPQNRDEELMGHRPFLVFADYLTRRGIAVLRADDRGVGHSTGNFSQATTADFASDVEAGMAYLKRRTEIDQHRIGLVGHSEGGIIAPMIAARNHEVSFILLIAGPGVPGEEIFITQNQLIEEKSGENSERIQRDATDLRQLLELVKQNQSGFALKRRVQERLEAKLPEAQIDNAVRQLSSPWFHYFLNYDPAAVLREVRCPVLAISGEKDLQVPARQNLTAIRKALEEGGNRDYQVIELPGLNHLLQTAQTGLPSEYPKIEETISPLALQIMGDWITSHTRLKRSLAGGQPR